MFLLLSLFLPRTALLNTYPAQDKEKPICMVFFTSYSPEESLLTGSLGFGGFVMDR